jgi:LysM repeat protein
LKILLLSKLLLALLCGAVVAQAQSLKGSPGSINRQYQAALSYGLAFVDTGRSVGRYVEPGHLVRVNPGRHLELHQVSYPYGVPATKLFLTRLSSQYHSACGQKLTVTSLLRPKNRQPANSVAKSVHPTGMAIDLRVPKTHKCRSWLERVLLSLEREGVLDVTRERRPPHYHVALFVKNYEKRLGIQPTSTQFAYLGPGGSYKVQRGDTLSEIAKLNGVSVASLRAANGLSGNRIYAGQKLRLPGATGSTPGKVSVAAVREGTHKVNRGDTLSDIAKAAGVSVASLRAANGLRGNRIYAGQKLQIPGATGANKPAQTSRPVVAARSVASRELTYKVNRGETLSQIAQATGVSVARLRAANGLRGNRIYAGQELDIPGAGRLGSRQEITHKVNRGDTLWRIANLYGTSVAQIRRVNTGAGDRLQVGQLLRITRS